MRNALIVAHFPLGSLIAESSASRAALAFELLERFDIEQFSLNHSIQHH